MMWGALNGDAVQSVPFIWNKSEVIQTTKRSLYRAHTIEAYAK